MPSTHTHTSLLTRIKETATQTVQTNQVWVKKKNELVDCACQQLTQVSANQIKEPVSTNELIKQMAVCELNTKRDARDDTYRA